MLTSRAKLYGGTVHVTKLERVELIDGDNHQECSLARQLKNSTRKLASGYFCLNMKKTISQKYSLNENMISEKYKHSVDILKHVEITKFQATNTNDMSLASPSNV